MGERGSVLASHHTVSEANNVYREQRAGAPPLPGKRPLAVVALLVEVARRAHGLVDNSSGLKSEGGMVHVTGTGDGQGEGRQKEQPYLHTLLNTHATIQILYCRRYDMCAADSGTAV